MVIFQPQKEKEKEKEKSVKVKFVCLFENWRILICELH